MTVGLEGMDEREYALRKAIEVALLYLIEMELAQEHIGPDSYLFIRRRLEEQHEEALEERRKDLTRLGPLPGAEDLHHAMEHVLEMLHQSCEAFCGSPGRPNPALILRSFEHLHMALEALYRCESAFPASRISFSPTTCSTGGWSWTPIRPITRGRRPSD